MAAQTVLAVGEACPQDLLDDLDHPATPLYSAVDVVRSLHAGRDYAVNVVRTRGGRMAVLKTYYKYRLCDVARQQVRCVCLVGGGAVCGGRGARRAAARSMMARLRR